MAYKTVPTVGEGQPWKANDNNTYLKDNFAANIPACYTTKGQIQVGTGVDAGDNLSIGANGKALICDSTQTLGLKWSDVIIPVGGIVFWTDSYASIPAGWQICDGTNGTPDLRRLFVVGAGGAYSPGDAGGLATHSHTQAATPSGGTHNHASETLTGNSSGSSGAVGTGSGDGSDPTHNHSMYAFGGDGAHSHTNPDTSSDAALPPNYLAFFIMRLT